MIVHLLGLINNVLKLFLKIHKYLAGHIQFC